MNKYQGKCDTTLTDCFAIDCKCNTYEGNLGVCLTWLRGSNGACVYCDHSYECHKNLKKENLIG